MENKCYQYAAMNDLNMLIQKMGPGWMAWADEFFHPNNGRLDTNVKMHMATEDARKRVSQNLTPKGFMERLKAYCQYKGYTLNPKHMLGKDGRIMKHVSVEEYRNGEIRVTDQKATMEYFYIKTKTEEPEAEKVSGIQLKTSEDKCDNMPL